MHIAKIIRHRHKRVHYINDDMKSIEEQVHYKILFSDPAEMRAFEKWCRKNRGNYKFDKAHSYELGKQPQIKLLPDDACWCDIMTYYLLHVADYNFHTVLEPYKGEVYVKG